MIAVASRIIVKMLVSNSTAKNLDDPISRSNRRISIESTMVAAKVSAVVRKKSLEVINDLYHSRLRLLMLCLLMLGEEDALEDSTRCETINATLTNFETGAPANHGAWLG